MPRTKIALTVAVILDSLLWWVPFAPLARHWNDRDLAADFNAAAALALIAVILWLSPRLRDRSDKRFQAIAAEYARREAVLIKTFASLAEAPGNPTGPLPRLRPVPSARRP